MRIRSRISGFLFDADADPDVDPAYQNDANLTLLTCVTFAANSEEALEQWRRKLAEAEEVMTGMETMMTATEEENRRLQVANKGQVGPGFEKTRLKKKTKKKQVVFWVFGFFWGFLLFIYPEKRGFRVFSVSRILLGASRL
jgi:hypothetical protein